MSERPFISFESTDVFLASMGLPVAAFEIWPVMVSVSIVCINGKHGNISFACTQDAIDNTILAFLVEKYYNTFGVYKEGEVMLEIMRAYEHHLKMPEVYVGNLGSGTVAQLQSLIVHIIAKKENYKYITNIKSYGGGGGHSCNHGGSFENFSLTASGLKEKTK